MIEIQAFRERKSANFREREREREGGNVCVCVERVREENVLFHIQWFFIFFNSYKSFYLTFFFFFE